MALSVSRCRGVSSFMQGELYTPADGGQIFSCGYLVDCWLVTMDSDPEIEALRTKYAKAEEVVELLFTASELNIIELWQTHLFVGILISATSAQKHLQRGFRERDVS